jgi:hypothetical protein
MGDGRMHCGTPRSRAARAEGGRGERGRDAEKRKSGREQSTTRQQRDAALVVLPRLPRLPPSRLPPRRPRVTVRLLPGSNCAHGTKRDAHARTKGREGGERAFFVSLCVSCPLCLSLPRARDCRGLREARRTFCVRACFKPGPNARGALSFLRRRRARQNPKTQKAAGELLRLSVFCLCV